MKTYSELSVNTILEEKCISIGTISPELATFIAEKRPELQIDTSEEIKFWDNRISHTELHKDDFMSDILYEDCFKSIPDFIKNPDYIGIKKDNSSISFIKKLSQDISVVIRINAKGQLSYRTMYPLMTAQLDHYIEEGTAWKYSNSGQNIDIDSLPK